MKKGDDVSDTERDRERERERERKRGKNWIDVAAAESVVGKSSRVRVSGGRGEKRRARARYKGESKARRLLGWTYSVFPMMIGLWLLTLNSFHP